MLSCSVSEPEAKDRRIAELEARVAELEGQLARAAELEVRVALEPAIWTIVTHPNVESTNNRAEPDIRHPVV